jgi:sulfur carrier protein
LQLFVNGETKDLPIVTLAELVKQLGHSGDWFAVIVDGAHVPKNQWGECQLTDHQRIEILTPMSGG